ncbi:MAG: hypothetical protein ABW061_01765 [Polyangiaceae bacterium]
MLHPSTKAAIDRWINDAPEFRRVESQPLSNDAWETKAVEDGAVLFEEVDLDTDEPVLRLLAAWCDQQSKIQPRPPVKAGTLTNAPESRPVAKSG